MSALIIAFKDFPFFTLLIIAHNVSNIGTASTIIGSTITTAVYVLATPKIDIIDSVNPKKFEPVSPINVFAGAKLNGKNPTNAPARDAINNIEIIGEPFNKNIINSDIAEITDIPDDKPSKPSIKLIAFVIPTTHKIVIVTDIISPNSCVAKNGIVTLSILIPNDTTIIAASNCPRKFS